MTDQQILEKAIQKAIDGGWLWKPFCGYGRSIESKNPSRTVLIECIEYDPGLEEYSKDLNGKEYSLIFNHDFARALWSDAIAQFPVGISGDTIHLNNIENWKGHLANMVVADDPIKYLEQNV